MFNEADKDTEKIKSKRLDGPKTIDLMQRYLQTPGKMIQLCRKFPEFVSTHQISEKSILAAQGFLKDITGQVLFEIDRTGGLIIFFEFLDGCINFFYSRSESPKMSPVGQEKLGNDGSKSSTKLTYLSESTEIKELAELNLDFFPYLQAKLQHFLSNRIDGVGSLEERILLYNQFERDIINEIRAKVLPKVINPINI